jgi:hypothetical protein
MDVSRSSSRSIYESKGAASGGEAAKPAQVQVAPAPLRRKPERNSQAAQADSKHARWLAASHWMAQDVRTFLECCRDMAPTLTDRAAFGQACGTLRASLERLQGDKLEMQRLGLRDNLVRELTALAGQFDHPDRITKTLDVVFLRAREHPRSNEMAAIRDRAHHGPSVVPGPPAKLETESEPAAHNVPFQPDIVSHYDHYAGRFKHREEQQALSNEERHILGLCLHFGNCEGPADVYDSIRGAARENRVALGLSSQDLARLDDALKLDAPEGADKLAVTRLFETVLNSRNQAGAI